MSKSYSQMSKEKRTLFRKIIGLGERSIRKSYYPALQAELETVAESARRFKQLFDSMHNAVLVCRCETPGCGKFTITQLNRAASDFFCIKHADAILQKSEQRKILTYLESGPVLSAMQAVSKTKKAQ